MENWNTMVKDFQEVIRKNLPQEVGETLKARLDKADHDATQVDHLNTQLALRDKKIQTLENQLKSQRDIEAWEERLKIKEKEVTEKEAKVNVDNLTNQLAVANDKANFCKDVAMGLVRNVEYRNEVYGSAYDPHSGGTYATNNTEIKGAK